MAPRRCFAPNNVAPFAGAVSDTVGAWFALGATVMLTAVDVVVDPTLSRAGYVDRCSLNSGSTRLRSTLKRRAVLYLARGRLFFAAAAELFFAARPVSASDTSYASRSQSVSGDSTSSRWLTRTTWAILASEDWTVWRIFDDR